MKWKIDLKNGNGGFLATVIALLLSSAILLTGCMGGIIAPDGEHSYDRDSSPAGSGETPTEQILMQKKFGAYLHESKNDNSVQIFSEGQYLRLKDDRLDHKRTPLTYDELLYLINDSIRLYFQYDSIILTRAAADGISLSPLRDISETITPYHGDFTEFKRYEDAFQTYRKVLFDIFSVIHYRLTVHDTGLFRKDTLFSMVSISGDEGFFGPDLIKDYDISGDEILLMDAGTRTDGDYPKTLWNAWTHLLSAKRGSHTEPCELPAPLVSVSYLSVDITDPKTLEGTQLYPTAELEDLQKTIFSEYYTVYDISGFGSCSDLLLIQKHTNKFNIGVKYCGSFSETDTRLTLRFSKNNRQVFAKEGDKLRHLPHESVGDESGYPFRRGSVFAPADPYWPS